MRLYTYQATVNYPDDEQDTPLFENLIEDQVANLLRRLLNEEGDCMTSCVITVVKTRE